MHSSRMHTARCSGRLSCHARPPATPRRHAFPHPLGTYAPQAHMPPPPVNRMTDACETRMRSSRMHTVRSSSHLFQEGVCSWGDGCLGVYPSMHWGRPLLEQNDRRVYKNNLANFVCRTVNITLPQTSFVGGNYGQVHCSRLREWWLGFCLTWSEPVPMTHSV